MKSDPFKAATTPGLALLCCLLAIALDAKPSHAGGIFDDNWTPPARKAPAKSGTPSTPRSPAETQPSAQPARRPIPGKLDQARSRDNLKQVFGADMIDSSFTGRRKLAAKLFDAVPKTADNPVDQYVLMGGAINAAKDGANLKLCLEITEFLSQMFEVDGVAIKADAALNMNLRGSEPSDAAENVAAGLEVLDLLMAEDDYASATRLNVLLKGLTPVVPSLAAMVQQKSKELDGRRLEHDRVVQQLGVLKTKPDDPSANLAVGKYYCFRTGDWAKGLPYLVKGSDADLKKAAEDELSGPTTPTENELVGNGWWKIGESQAEPARETIFTHAALFYKVAVRDATGLAKMNMQRKLDQVSPAAPDGVGVRQSNFTVTKADVAAPGDSTPGSAASSTDVVSRPKLLQVVKEIQALYLRRNKGGRGGFFVGGEHGAPGHPGSKAEMDNLLALTRATAGQATLITSAELDSLLKAIARTRSQVESDGTTTHGTGEEAAKFIEQRLDQVAAELRPATH